MKEESFANVSPEITIDILSRLPIPTILSCKCVCKSWLDLIESLEFANSHHSKSVPSVVCHQVFGEEPYKVFESIDEPINPQHLPPFCFKFNFPFPKFNIHSSVDGLLFLFSSVEQPLFICNPINREYIELPALREKPSYSSIFGFGASKITGLYKLVMIEPPKCGVYTLGTGYWRNIAADGSIFKYKLYEKGVLLNGNLHLLADDLNRCPRISCFDLETELFSTFSLPCVASGYYPANLIVLEDHLCLCFIFDGDEVYIWLMKEYGDDKSWMIRKFCIDNPMNYLCAAVVKALKDGIVIVHQYGLDLLLFSTKNTIRKIKLAGLNHYTNIVAYKPSFLPVLKTLLLENVRSL